MPWGAVLLLGLGVVAYYVADTAISTWSTIYLGDVLLAAASFAPLGYAAYLTTTLGSRLAGDPLVRRWGRVVVLRVAALVGAAGLVLVVVAPGPVGRAGRLRGRRCRARRHRAAVLLGRRERSRRGTPTRSSRGSTSSTTSVRCSVACSSAPSAARPRCTYGFLVPIVLVVAVAVLAGRFGVTRHDRRPATADAGAGA